MSQSHRILITSGPTREYFDPVRFLTNASSGRMGVALAEAVLERGDIPVIVSGPVSRAYLEDAVVHHIETTEQMLRCCKTLLPDCEGVIGAAAPCDFKPVVFFEQKMSKSDAEAEFAVRLKPTPDILATLGRMKRPYQWIIGFALETQNGKEHAMAKLRRKNCDLVVLNGPESIDSDEVTVEVFDAQQRQVAVHTGTKRQIAANLLAMVKER